MRAYVCRFHISCTNNNFLFQELSLSFRCLCLLPVNLCKIMNDWNGTKLTFLSGVTLWESKCKYVYSKWTKLHNSAFSFRLNLSVLVRSFLIIFFVVEYTSLKYKRVHHVTGPIYMYVWHDRRDRIIKAKKGFCKNYNKRGNVSPQNSKVNIYIHT